MQKTLQKITFLLIIVFHFSFLVAVFMDNRENLNLYLILLPVSVLLVFFYLNIRNSYEKIFKKRDLISISVSTYGALLTYFFNLKLNIGVVLAAGIIGLLGSIIPLLNKNSEILKLIPPALYCGAFAGMTAPFVANGYLFIFFAGLATGILYVMAKNILNGYGGKLGSIAFGGVSIVYSILYLFT
ncbi:hypothetical protein [Christiangramia crocea]|uniref:Uncharacterized protein n=1 Tax=Christiangramia crocea TaxID=2904124 RepID=A0A9X2A436_9FLAO|nr:hypothetical protein [Gramella crocea]MCG9970364.1 hypothetical protein [Gramella crocea]